MYGTETLRDLETQISRWAQRLDVEVSFLQTNHEGSIIDALHEASDADGIVLNPGAYTHTSRAIADAIVSIDTPVVEVHISNVKQREPWRAESLLETVVQRSIFGRGLSGYRDALRFLINRRTPSDLISYGPHPENIGDLRVPDQARSAIMLVHGGFWLQEYGRDSMDSIAVDLFQRGIATYNIEYRRTNAGGVWPASGEDVWLAFNHLNQHSPLAGLPSGVVGHSAGGYLTLHLAKPGRIDRVTVLAPITDLQLLATQEGPGRDPAQEMIAAGAPHTVDSPAARVFHGDRDQLVAPTHSERLDDAEVTILADTGHFDLLNPGNGVWGEVVASLE